MPMLCIFVVRNRLYFKKTNYPTSLNSFGDMTDNICGGMIRIAPVCNVCMVSI